MNMLKHLTRIVLAVAAVAWIAGCANYDSDIDKINERIDGIEDNRIKTIEQQIERINASLPELEKADQNLKGLIEALQGKAGELAKDIEKNAGRIDEANSLIAELQKKDSELEKKIADLKTYVDGGIKNAKDWASATFATLEQYNGIVEEVAGLGKRLDGALERISGIDKRLDGIDGRLDGLDGSITELDKKLDKSIEEVKTSVSDLEKSLKGWVNERLTAYWTIEETKAALANQKDSLERRMKAQRDSLLALIAGNTGEIGSLKSGLEETDKAVKDNAESISTLRSDLEKAKADIKTAYEKAIKDAVGEAEGRISEKIAAEVETINDRIDSVVNDVNDKLEALGERVSSLETDLKTLKDRFERRIQSLTLVPTYSDGVERYEKIVVGGEFKKCRDLTLRFEVRPHSAAGSVTREQVSANAINTITRASAGDIKSLDIKDFSADTETGIITVAIDPAGLYKAYQENGISSSVRIAVTDPSGLYDIASEYVAVEPIKDPGAVSYKTKYNQKLEYYELRLYDPNGDLIETLDEFSEDKFTVFSPKEASFLELRIEHYDRYDRNEYLEYFSIHKPIKIDFAAFFFQNSLKLESVELRLLDTRDVTNMAAMFNNCRSLKSLDLSGWDTQNVNSMQFMFASCESLASINLSGWNTRNVNTMRFMFGECKSLSSIDLSGFDTRSVTDMQVMFYKCESLASLDLSGFDTRKVSNMEEMFIGCENLATLDLSGWNMLSVTDMQNMFNGCANLATITMRGCDESAVQKIEAALTAAGIRDNVTIVR